MKPYGMHIECVDSGQKAIDAMNEGENRFDAVFMDQMMPGMDGIEATQRIRELPTDYARNVPIIALTANAVVGNEEMFLSRGFQAFLSKPIDIARLDMVIRQWVQDKSVESEGLDNNNVDTPENHIFDNVHIEGIDLQEGLERFSRDGEAYLQVLRSYSLNTRNLLDSIKEVNKENLFNYAITVHGIKGSSHSICANLVGDIAEALEKAAKDEDFGYVLEKNQDLVQTADKLLADLDEMQAEIAAKVQKPLKTRPDRDMLIKILDGCNILDMETVEASVRELENYEYETDGELVHWLWENVQQFNIDEIIAKLTDMNLSEYQ
jgi:CheY-like chemotaxis protein